MTEETKEQPKGLFDKFMDLYAPLAQQDTSFSSQDYAQDFREKQNYVLKQLGLISPTSGVTTPENTRPVEDIIMRNASQDQPTMDTITQYVKDRVGYNPELGPVPIKNPDDPDEYNLNQMLEITEINRMFDSLLQADDFVLPTISVDQRSAYTSHLLSKPYDAREELAKKLVSKDLKALEGLDDINAFYAGFDRETQMEDLEVPANIAAGVDGVMSSDPYQKLFEMGVDPKELEGIVIGESGGDPAAKNKKTKAAGLFQFMPVVAKELGTTTDKILAMSVEDQVNLYKEYLNKWGWKPGVPLGLMQAAPALSRNWNKRNKSDVVYKKDSKAWKQNPGWRPEDGGDITIASIEAYYRDKTE